MTLSPEAHALATLCTQQLAQAAVVLGAGATHCPEHLQGDLSTIITASRQRQSAAIPMRACALRNHPSMASLRAATLYAQLNPPRPIQRAAAASRVHT